MSGSDGLTAYNAHRPVPRSFLFLLLASLWFAIGIAHADEHIELRSVYVVPKDDLYALHGQLVFDLPDGARKAIEQGATFNLSVEANIKRKRSLWYDAVEADIAQQYEVVYHAVSGRYVVRNVNSGDQESFATLDASLDRLKTLNGIALIGTAESVPEQSDHEVSVRATLLVRSLPRVLRILLFWTNDWQQTSDWYTWTLRP